MGVSGLLVASVDNLATTFDDVGTVGVATIFDDVGIVGVETISGTEVEELVAKDIDVLLCFMRQP